MSININQSSNHKKPGTGKVLLGALAGSYVNGLTVSPSRIASSRLMSKMSSINEHLTKDEFCELQKGITKAFNESGLAKKGVEILRAGENNMEETAEAVAKEYSRGILKHVIPENIRKFVGGIYSRIFTEGGNAAYLDSAKKIVIPEDKLQLAFFHEAGHALNANMNSITKVLQYSRVLGLLVLPISLIALFKNKKEEGEESNGFLDKATDFVKNNAGKLTFATFVPMLIEEGLATLKGNKMAQNVLSADLAKKVAKTNAYGFASYMILAALSSLGIHLATKVRDKVVSGEKEKNTNKEAAAEKIVTTEKITNK